MAYEQGFSAKMYKRELMHCRVTAGVAVLFGSPLAGWLFAMEVIARKINKSLAISCTASAIIAGLFIFYSTINLYWILALVAGNGELYHSF